MRQLIFRFGYYQGLKNLPDKERLAAYDAIGKYAFEGIDSMKTPFLIVVKESIEADFLKYYQKVGYEQKKY